MIRRMVLLGAFAGAGLAFADNAYWYGGSGRFSDENHWENKLRPTSASVVGFRPSADAVIDVDENAAIQYWSVIEQPAGTDPTFVKLTGSGTIRSTGSSSSAVNPGRTLVVNGASVVVDKNMIVTNSIVSVKAGALMVGDTMHLRGPAVLNLEGGVCKSKFVVAEAARINFTGGTLCWASNQLDFDASGKEYQKMFLPRGGEAVLDVPYKTDQKAMILRKADESRFDGTIMITNRNASVHPGVFLYKTDYTFSGEGSLVADQMCIDSAGKTLTCRLVGLSLGYGMYESNTTAAKYAFPDGIAFGAWGDWSNNPLSAATPVDVSLAGDVRFDTKDCLNGETTHTITLTGVVDAGMKSLKAIGGGTVVLDFPAGFAAELNKIEVGAGTTLDLTGVGAKIFVRDLVLGAGAVLKIDAGKCPIEVSGEQTVDSTARINATVSTALTAQKLYPVFDSLVGLPEGVLILTGPTGWSCANVGGCVFLTDGNNPVFPYGDTVYAWTGAASSSWNEAGNWTKNAVPYGSTEAYFARVDNANVVYDLTGSYAGQIRNLTFHSSCGPFLVTGGELKPSYGSATSQSLTSDSEFPVVVSNFVACASAPGGSIMNRGKSYVALVGGGSTKGILRVRGEVRLGGEWTATNVLEAAQTTPGARATKLTVLECGTLSMTADGTPVVPPKNARIDGSLVLDGALEGLDDLNWTGSGVVKMTGDSAFDIDQTLTVRDGLHLVPTTDWKTTSATLGGVSKIAFDATATLGATGSWTYGPSTGASASARALSVAEGATLTIDTEDPTTGTGHKITFADPICGAGNVVKKGAGALVLATGDSQVEGSFAVAEGGLELGGALAAASGWVRVLTAASFDGVEEALGSRYKCRFVEADNGLTALEVKSVGGLILIFR